MTVHEQTDDKYRVKRQRADARRREVMFGTSPVITVNKAALILIIGAALTANRDTDFDDVIEALMATEESDL